MPNSHRPGLINAVVLAAILGALFGFNYVVDPFGRDNAVNLGLDKFTVAADMSDYAWKYAEYPRIKAPVVLLGDSRTRRLPADEFETLLGKPTYNFAFGGATGPDVVEAFWYAAESETLTHAYLGLGVLLLNDGIRGERGRDHREGIEQPLRYYFSPFITKASVYVLIHHWTGRDLTGETPPMDREAFWAFQLGPRTRMFYEGWQYPTHLMERLAEVAAYSAENDIDLTFFMPPGHIDLQDKRDEHGIQTEYERALEELSQLGRVVDFDFANSMTRNEANFGDPFHTTDDVSRQLARDLVLGDQGLAR
ncbi:MAG: hypothetical protein GY898_29335 [Proteobacteria bacterium]|nr:hypothetical protein [Pseudomonadota bacterium]